MPDASCLQCKFYQPVRVHDPFLSFPNQRQVRGRYLGLAEDARDDLTFIVQVVKNGKKSRLLWSIIKELHPITAHDPKIRANIL